jgi:methyl-accepting chemotaxis protein
MNSLRVSTRLAITLALAALLLLAVGAMGAWGIRSANESLKTVYDDRVVPLGQLGQIQRLMAANQQAVEAAVADRSQAEAAGHTVATNRGAIDALWNAYMATQLTADEERLARQFAAERAAFVQQGLQPALQALRQGELDRAQQLARGALAQGATATRTTMEQLMALQVTVAQEAFAAAQARYQRLVAITATLMALGCAGVALMGWLLNRSLTRQLGAEPAEAQALAQAVASGELDTAIALRAGDATSLMAALAQMQASLRRAVGSVRRDADGVATASTEIAQGTLDLSQRTEEQASALQQTAASMEQLGSTVRQNAEHAQEAQALAEHTAAVAQRGGTVVREVVGTMQGIEDSSRRIADIVGTIDSIAFQTNILALNAAVEAARAGEQGRGFAVVASEVRSLAQRSADAAREVKTLISQSVERVDAGARRVADAGATMQQIEASVAQLLERVAQISAATVEQSSGVQQIGEAVTQMDQVTQQNAALVEESSAAAESLRHQAAQLLAAVAVFRLGDEAPAAPAMATAARAPTAPAGVARATLARVSQASRGAAHKPSAGSGPTAPATPAPAADWASF